MSQLVNRGFRPTFNATLQFLVSLQFVLAASCLIMVSSVVAQDDDGTLGKGSTFTRMTKPRTAPPPEAAARSVTTPVASPVSSEAKGASTPSKPPPKLEKGSIISSTVQSGSGKLGISTTSDTDLDGGTLPAISGSVSKKGSTWSVVLANNSDARYSLSVTVVQVGANGGQVKSDYISTSLQPGEKIERTLQGANGAVGAQLVMGSSRRTEVAKNKAATANPSVTPNNR